MKAHEVSGIRVRGTKLLAVIDGRAHTFELAKVSRRFADASMEELQRFEVSPSGYGIHWPLLDEDLSIDGLLGISHRPERAGDTRRDRVGKTPPASAPAR